MNEYIYAPQKKENLGIDLLNFSLEKQLKIYDGIEMQGWNILVQLYIQTEKTEGGILIPDLARDEEQYRSCVGLVIKKSKASYEDPRYRQTGHWCKVGDWVVFPRHAGYKISVLGAPTFILKEDAIDFTIDDPTKIAR